MLTALCFSTKGQRQGGRKARIAIFYGSQRRQGSVQSGYRYSLCPFKVIESISFNILNGQFIVTKPHGKMCSFKVFIWFADISLNIFAQEMLEWLNQYLRINVAWSLVLHLDHFVIYVQYNKRSRQIGVLIVETSLPLTSYMNLT